MLHHKCAQKHNKAAKTTKKIKSRSPLKAHLHRSITTTSVGGKKSLCGTTEDAYETDDEATYAATPGIFPVGTPKPLFLLCDIQEPFRKRMTNYPRLIESSKFLLNFAKIMKYDVLVSEQTPLAGTALELVDLLATFPPNQVQKYSKRRFSMIAPLLDKSNQDTQHIKIDFSQYNSVVLFGLESHVCILQTYNDLSRLLPTDVPIYLVTDATYSQRDYDRTSALRQMTDAVQISSESLVYGFLGSADNEGFKPMLEHVKNHAKWIADNGDVQASI